MNVYADRAVRLYTTVSEGLALTRYGATALLSCSKFWSTDGWLVDSESAGPVLCGAYSVQDLLSIRTERKMDVEVTGNSRYDLSMAMVKILAEMRRIMPMPFRVWLYDGYVSSSRGSKLQYVVGQSGSVRLFRMNGRTFEELEPAKGAEVERSTGYDDRHGVPIFQNDAVTVGGRMLRVTQLAGGWQMVPIDGDESTGIELASSRLDACVISSSRTDPSMLARIASVMEAQDAATR